MKGPTLHTYKSGFVTEKDGNPSGLFMTFNH